MKKTSHISDYETMTKEELIAEDKLQRQAVREPTLTLKHHLMNFAISIPGIGGTVASFFALGFQIFKPPRDGKGFTDRLEEFTGRWIGREESEHVQGYKKEGFAAARKKFLEDDNFRQNVNATAIVFAVVSAVTAILTYRSQHREVSEDGVTRATEIKNVMRGRGYLRMESGEFVKREDADRHYGRLAEADTAEIADTQKEILSKVEQLEKSLKKEAELPEEEKLLRR